MPSSLRSIGEGAFYENYKLQSINLPQGIVRIEQGAFQGCEIKQVSIPASVIEIGTAAFGFVGERGRYFNDPGPYEIEGFTINGYSGSAAQRYAQENGFVFVSLGTYDGFFDVNKSDWFGDAVSYVRDHNYMTGMSTNWFGPAETLSRAQFATILYRIAGSPGVQYSAKFPDVPSGTWYSDPVIWASNAGVVTGYQNGTFGPADNINREQLAVMMYRYAQYCGYNTGNKADLSKYPDAGKVSAWAVDAMRWAVGTGIITGKNGGQYLDPAGNASRAECAVIIQRFMEKYA